MDKKETLVDYYDQWGNRCYLFSAKLWDECGGVCYKTKTERTLEDWALQTDALKDLGGRYIFSVARLSNAQALGLTLVNFYEDESSFYNVYVYEL